MWNAMHAATANTGATNAAAAIFDSTVVVSEIGSDLKNSTLRSRRSS